MEDLKNTVKDMLSPDYTERFRAEYQQLAIRTARLKDFLLRIENGEDVKHDCPTEILEIQYKVMSTYLYILEQRSVIENIMV